MTPGWTARTSHPVDGIRATDPHSRSFLFLQGPQSRFFRRLGLAIRDTGARILKVNICGGDVFHWPRPCTCLYRGSRGDWPQWVAEAMDRHAVTDILLMGDKRPMNRDAICIARSRGIAVHVLEEGYLRPNHITLERDGVNTRSRLPATPEAVRREAGLLPDPPAYPNVPDSMKIRVRDTIRHHVGNFLLWGLFPRYRTHRPYTIGWELTGWLPRYATRRRRQARALAAQTALLDSGRPYFLFPLQLDADIQVRSYSHFGVRDSIMQVLSSFAASAPRDMTLVVKNHPLDNGLINLDRFVNSFARATGIRDRVVFLDGGQGRLLMERDQCLGVALVNSTMGLEALALDRPVFSLGRAPYAMPGLAATQTDSTLDEFWTDPHHPDPRLLRDFVKILLHKALVLGNFYTDWGIELAVEGSLRRLGLVA
ncbi:capsular biosynthesis protein [Desulfolutivibrio sulfodismutans DSM 3696]|nr:capsular biosynthesis protein [Desulfolutivibrio sulfodismutans DSM 3696]